MKKIKYTIFENATKAHQVGKNAKVVTTDIKEFSEKITENIWSPFVFKEGIRRSENFESVEMLVLDIDDGCSLEEAKKFFKDYRHVISTTKSHQELKNGIKCDRFRVVLFLSEPITDYKTYKKTWDWAHSNWPFIDPACKDVARFYFASTKGGV